jgi:hypothetical protein
MDQEDFPKTSDDHDGVLAGWSGLLDVVCGKTILTVR